jgi:hypothetical protein
MAVKDSERPERLVIRVMVSPYIMLTTIYIYGSKITETETKSKPKTETVIITEVVITISMCLSMQH